MRTPDDTAGFVGNRVGDPADRAPRAKIVVDGVELFAYHGESIAAALLAAGLRTLRRSALKDDPRGVYCCMGVCYECVVIADGHHFVRACMTPVEEGMRIDTRGSRAGGYEHG